MSQASRDAENPHAQPLPYKEEGPTQRAKSTLLGTTDGGRESRRASPDCAFEPLLR